MLDDAKSGISTSEYIYLGNTTSNWDAKDNGTWKRDGATSFYDWMTDCRRLLLTRDEPPGLKRIQSRTARSMSSLMSCGTQLIPHVTLDVVGVFRALGVNFVAGTGP
jgi:hypothetical protein